MTWARASLLAFGALYVYATQVWAWKQPHFQPIGKSPP